MRIRNIIAGAVLAAVAGTAGSAVAGTTHETKPQRVDIPTWVTRQCEGRYDVNCRHDHARHVSVVRELPGSAHMVCVFYAESDYARTHDYCA